MKAGSNDCSRHKEIVAFYYQIFGVRVHKGMAPRPAREQAEDAVTLRYGITASTLRNIISMQKTYQGVKDEELREKALSLITELNTMNEGLAITKERNDKLIALLKECFDDNR